ncbi:MAG TPA: hypothetical protein VG015_07980 [Candidatus Dormibacteraeota bacterium]|nr:hypothetical protein [Candidatus Dormibacteraeota bacterium]
MNDLIELFDRLILERNITGYTVEPEPHHLGAGRPLLSYSMYTDGQASRDNLQRFVDDMDRLGADLSFHQTLGSTLREGSLRRTSQLTAIAWFDDPGPLAAATEVVRRRYLAGSGESIPGSWVYPDVRICGIRSVPQTIAALAHYVTVQGQSVVALSASGTPPAPGMTTRPVRLLNRWGRYLAWAG